MGVLEVIAEQVEPNSRQYFLRVRPPIMNNLLEDYNSHYFEPCVFLLCSYRISNVRRLQFDDHLLTTVIRPPQATMIRIAEKSNVAGAY